MWLSDKSTFGCSLILQRLPQQIGPHVWFGPDTALPTIQAWDQCHAKKWSSASKQLPVFAKKLFSVTAVKDLLKTCYNLSNISVLNDIKSFWVQKEHFCFKQKLQPVFWQSAKQVFKKKNLTSKPPCYMQETGRIQAYLHMPRSL